MSNIKRKLDDLGRKIESRKTGMAQKEGSIKTNKERLKKEFKLTTTTKAEEELKKISKQTDRIQSNLDSDFAKLEERY